MRILVFALALVMAGGTAQADKHSLLSDWGDEISKAIQEAIIPPPDIGTTVQNTTCTSQLNVTGRSLISGVRHAVTIRF